MPGLCAIPIYGKEYTIGKKDKDGNWNDETLQPSVFEKTLYDYLSANESNFVGDGKVVSGHISHLPNTMLETFSGEQLVQMVTGNTSLTLTQSTGKLPEYKLPYSKSFKKSGGKSWGMTPEQRIDFLNKQLTNDIQHVDWKSDKTLAELTDRMTVEHADNPNFITIYFDLLTAAIK